MTPKEAIPETTSLRKKGVGANCTGIRCSTNVSSTNALSMKGSGGILRSDQEGDICLRANEINNYCIKCNLKRGEAR
jgi:hypothetical protein